MLFRGKIAVYSEDYKEHINTPWGQNADPLLVKRGALRITQAVQKSAEIKQRHRRQ
jgi:hypothetical protein